MVKPMEARKPSPTTRRIVSPSAGRATPRRDSNHVENTMPKGLPRNRPSATPNATFVEKTTEPSIPAKDTPALAKAKMGITTNDTKGCMACSSRCEGGMASRVSFRICATTSSCLWSSVETPLGSMREKARRCRAARFR